MENKLRNILVSDSIISEEELDKIISQYNLKENDIGVALVNLGYLDQKELESIIIKKNNQMIKETEMIIVLFHEIRELGGTMPVQPM